MTYRGPGDVCPQWSVGDEEGVVAVPRKAAPPWVVRATASLVAAVTG